MRSAKLTNVLVLVVKLVAVLLLFAFAKSLGLTHVRLVY